MGSPGVVSILEVMMRLTTEGLSEADTHRRRAWSLIRKLYGIPEEE